MALPAKKPKIAILTTRTTHSQSDVLACLKVFYAFAEQYFQPTVFFLGFDPEISTSVRNLKFHSTTKPLSYFGMNCIEVGARWAFWEPGHYAFTRATWKELLDDYDYFFVVSNTCITAHPLVLLGKKFILWVGTTYSEDRAQRFHQLRRTYTLFDSLAKPIMNYLEHLILRKSNTTLALSAHAQKALTKKMKFFTVTPIQHCGFPIKNLQAVQGPITTKENIIVAVGHFSDPRKNLTMLLQAFELMYQKNQALQLFIVGLPPTQKELAAFDHLSSMAQVTFTGQLGRDDLDTLYSKAKLLLISSVHERLGIVGLEALQQGTPVITTTCGGPQDYVIDGHTGYSVPINDSAAMAEKALHVLACAVRYKQISQDCTALIDQKYSEKTVHALFAKSLQAVYPELTGAFDASLNQAEAYQPAASQSPQHESVL